MKAQGGRGGRKGVSLPEVLVTLLLLGLIVQAGWTLLATFRRASERAQETAEALETARIVGWILGQELSGGTRETFWFGEGTDSLSLRAMRGVAMVLGRPGPQTLLVCHLGLRRPNPAKDSILVLSDLGHWRAMDLLRSDAGGEGCWDGSRGREEVWEVGESLGAASWYLARVFERGSYHLSDGAFRYRGGGGGRQPLTVENLAKGSFRPLGPRGEGVIWRFQLTLEGSASHWRGRVR